MSQHTSLIMAALMVASVVAAIPVSGAAVTTPAADTADVPPGERLSGVLIEQDAQLRGDLDERTFGVAMARAGTDETRAKTVAITVANLSDHLDALEERKATLDERLESGEIDEREYRLRMSRIVAELTRVERMLAVVDARSGGVHPERLAAQAVERGSTALLHERSRTLVRSGDVETVRPVIGDRAAASVRPSDEDLAHALQHRIDHAGDALARSAERIERARMSVADDEHALRALDRALAEVESGKVALQSARDAAEAGDVDAAVRYVNLAINHAHTADALTQRAIEMAAHSDDDATDSLAERAERQVVSAAGTLADAAAVVERAKGHRGVGDNPDAREYLERANAELEHSEAALADARVALERGEYRRAIELADSVTDHAAMAERYAQRAMDVAFAQDDADRAERAIEHAASAVAHSQASLERAADVVEENDEDAQRYLDEARSYHGEADRALADARAALERGDLDAAYRLAQSALSLAEISTELSERAIAAADGDSLIHHHEDEERDDHEIDEEETERDHDS